MGSLLKIWSIKILAEFKNLSAADQLLIFSDPRGGGTWLTEIIGVLPNTAVIWEPLNIRYVEQFRKLEFAWRQHIPEDAEWNAARIVFSETLRGKVINEWTCLKTGLFDYLKAERFIIKFCRGHMLLPWLVKQFQFNFPPVYLVRHPMAVVASQLSHRGWDFDMQPFRLPDSSFNEVYLNHEPFLKSLESKEERLTAIWCISNSIPLNHPGEQKWITVFYEDLARDPESEIERILNRWKIGKPSGIQSKFRKLSSTSMSEIDFKNIEKHLGSWKKSLSDQQIKRMDRVLDYFKIRIYDGGHLLPRKPQWNKFYFM